jgi:hypothetical protein
MSGRRRTTIPPILVFVLATLTGLAGFLPQLIPTAAADEAKKLNEVKEVRQMRAKDQPPRPKDRRESRRHHLAQGGVFRGVYTEGAKRRHSRGQPDRGGRGL